MQQGARYQAILELISEIFKDIKPADGIIDAYLKTRKYIGSKDRRFIIDTVWTIIRNRMKLEFDARSKECRKVLLTYLKQKGENIDDLFNGNQYCPEVLTKEEKLWLDEDNEEVYPPYVEAETPEWLYQKIQDVHLLKSLNEPASADFRINIKNRDVVLQNLAQEGYDFAKTPYSPIGVRSHDRISLGNCMAYQSGEIDVQDEASQLAAILCDVQPEHKTIDYCCGAGGKSLTISFINGGQGVVLAHDISQKRLEAIKPRMQRLGIKNIEFTDFLADNDSDFDRFIVDAPCSGTGTWRRSPDAKFRLTQKKLAELVKTQKEILDIAYAKTKRKGRIVYMTCSILTDEDEQVVQSFLQKYDDVSLVSIKDLWNNKIGLPYPGRRDDMLKLSPLTSGTDGFFICVMEKN